MKSLVQHINESLNVDDASSEIRRFINENYDFDSIKISDKPNKDGKYEVNAFGDVEVKNLSISSLTNGMFVWGTVKGSFRCHFCTELETLEGCPSSVDDEFTCENAISLKSLNGAPKKVGGNFICSGCTSLTDLKGSPTSIPNGWFLCNHCTSLKTLDGAPKTVDDDFRCHNCTSLKSLKGAPKVVGCDFTCFDCGVDFTEYDVLKSSKVKGEIMC